MKVRDAITQLSALPQDMEILDDYAENVLVNFYVSYYDDDNGTTDYVIAEFAEVVGLCLTDAASLTGSRRTGARNAIPVQGAAAVAREMRR